MSSPEIELGQYEIIQGAMLGVMRQAQNIRKGRKPRYGAGEENDWQIHVEGVLGELALAKHLGIYYAGIGRLRAPDVGTVDVRTRSRHDYDLMLHREDSDDRVYWLITGLNGRYRVRGWILGKDGKQDRWWADKSKKNRWAFFVPASELHQP